VVGRFEVPLALAFAVMTDCDKMATNSPASFNKPAIESFDNTSARSMSDNQYLASRASFNAILRHFYRAMHEMERLQSSRRGRTVAGRLTTTVQATPQP
jgi:hypothetical protein